MDATIEAAQPAVSGGTVDASIVQDAAHQEASLAPPLKEPLYSVSLRSVRSNPLDWTSFTTLLSEADKLGQISSIREAYSVFLARWPLCFGYVKRWAEHELRLGGADGSRHALTVYENALAAAPAVVELWIAYCTFLLSPASGASPEQVRHALHRATHACSLDPKAGALWSQWAEFEYQTANAAAASAEGSLAASSDAAPASTSAGVQAAAAVYARGLACEAPYVEMLWQKYRALAASAPAAADLLTPGDDADAAAVQQRAAAIAQARGAVSSAGSGADGAGAGASASDASSSASAAAAEVTDADVRAAVMERREALCTASAAAAALRRGYEAAVAKRPFFHVKPLDAAALAGWRDYLSFEERRGPGNAARCEALYGRCLVACANYSEFWLRYAAFRRAYVLATANSTAGAAAPAASLSAGAGSSSAVGAPLGDATAVASAEAAIPVLQRAVAVFLPRRIDVHLALAAHLEAAGRRAEALGVLQRLVDPSVAPAPDAPPSGAAAEASAPGAGAEAGAPAGTETTASSSPAGPSGWAADSAEVAVRFAHALARGGDVLAAVEALSAASRREAVRADAGAAAGVFAAYVRLSEDLHGSSSSSSSSSASSSPSPSAAGGGAAGADAVRAVHEEAVAACPGELSVWLAYADFEARQCRAASRGDVAALRAVYRRALALPDAVASAAASAPTAGGGAAAADSGSGPSSAVSTPALPTGRLNAESAAVALAAYVAAMDAHAGPSPSQVSMIIEAQEAAAAWDRARTAAGLDGLGALVGTAFAAQRLREPPSTLHAAAAAAAAKAAAAAAAAQATAAANAAHAAELARLREQHAAELAAISAASAAGVGRKRGAAEAGLAADGTDAAGSEGGAGAGTADAVGAALAPQAKQARTGDVGGAAGAGDGYSAAAAAAAMSAGHPHAAWQAWHAGQSAGAPAVDPAGYGGYMPGPHGYPGAPGMAAAGYGAHPGYYGGAGGNMPPAQSAYGWGAGAPQGWGGY